MSAHRRKVLLVDDIELFRELEKTFLQREDIQLLVARTGQEALETIRRVHPDLVVLDLHMQELDGPAVCRAVKADPDLRSIPVIIVASGSDEAERLLCSEAGCSAFLDKPINRNTLLATVRGHLQIIEREAHRVPARILVRYGREGDRILKDYSVNLSTGGVYIETEHSFELDEPLFISFVLPERVDELHCRARVAWVNAPGHLLKPLLPAGIGVQFLDLSGTERAEVLSFVKNRLLSPLW